MRPTIHIKSRFRNAIRRGTGEAHLLIQQHREIDFSADIIKACIKNFAYDGQCENNRAPYLFELIGFCRNKEKIRKAILKALDIEQADIWTLTQLFHLAKLSAEHGDKEAKKAIYDRFFNRPIDGADWAGYAEIIELDGIEGLKFIAEKIGRSLAQHPDDWQDNTIIDHFQRINPEIDAEALLAEAGQNNGDIRAYLENVQRTVAGAKIYQKKSSVSQDIVEEVLLNKQHFRYPKQGLAVAELQIIAERLLVEKNKINREKLLSVFERFKFPLHHQLILDLASRKIKSTTKAANLAIDALRFLSSESIRNFAIKRIATSNNPGPLTRILKANYKKGDARLLTSLVDRYKNEHIIESLAISYVDIYQSNAIKECKEPLEALYHKSTCAIHRADLVKILITNHVLSAQIKAEIKFDCNGAIRKLVDEFES